MKASSSAIPRHAGSKPARSRADTRSTHVPRQVESVEREPAVVDVRIDREKAHVVVCHPRNSKAIYSALHKKRLDIEGCIEVVHCPTTRTVTLRIDNVRQTVREMRRRFAEAEMLVVATTRQIAS